MIYHNQVNAYVLNPSLANVVPKDSNDNSVIPSDMIINKYAIIYRSMEKYFRNRRNEKIIV